MTRAMEKEEIIMQMLKAALLATGVVVLTGCADWDPYFVHQRDVCIDRWYGYWDKPCPAPPAKAVAASASSTDELDAAMRDIANLQKRVGYLDRELAAANQRAADLEGRGGPTEADISYLQKRIASLEKQLADCEARLAGMRSQSSPAESRLSKAERDLVKALQPEISRGTVSVRQSGDALTINLASSLLFDSGQDQLKPAGADALRRVGGVLKDFPEKQVHVAGYTDNVAIRGALKKKFPSNQELSDARANNAAQALRDGGVSSNLSAAGHGDSDPVASNDTPAGRAKNRRVEVIVK
ncbi:MAG TPA: OmpA family protein [Nitrospira sp.]|nr:OmpA family protein [Nitrospira sp.]